MLETQNEQNEMHLHKFYFLQEVTLKMQIFAFFMQHIVNMDFHLADMDFYVGCCILKYSSEYAIFLLTGMNS